MKKLFIIALSFFMFACSEEEEDCTPTPTLITNEPSAITDTAVTFSGTIEAPTCDPTVTSQGFVYSFNTLPKITDEFIEVNGKAISKEITGLQQNRTYYYRTYFTNPTGTYYGNEIMFKTQIGDASSNPTSIIKVTAFSAELSSSVTTDGGSEISLRGVCWNTTGSPVISDAKTENGSGRGSFTSSLTGLTRGTKYYVRTYAVNQGGTTYSEETSFTTRDGIVSLTSKNISDITSNSCLGGGSIIDDGGATITSRGVCWSTNPNPTIEDNKTENGLGIGSFTSSLTGLTKETKYYVRAYAVNEAGVTYSKFVSFETLDTDTDKDGVLDKLDNCMYTFNPLQEDTDGDGIGDYCDDDNLILANELNDYQRSFYPDFPFIKLENNPDFEDGWYFIKSKAESFSGELSKLNTSGNWDLRFLKYYTSLTKIYTASIGNFTNFTLPESSETLIEIDMQFHNTIDNTAHISLSNHTNLKRIRIGSISSIESFEIKNLPSLEYLDISISNFNGNYIDIDLTNNVGVEVDGKRRIGYVKVTGALSKIIIDGVLISNLSANPKSQDNLVFETYFDYDMMWGNSLDLRYSNIKKLKIKNLDWLSNLKLNADLECINSDNNQLFNDVLVNGSIKTFRNNTYYTLTRNLETPWGDWEQYYYWYISEKVLDILSDNCFH